MTAKLGNRAFLSYRQAAVSDVGPTKDWLVKTGRFDTVVSVKASNERIALSNELLLPFEWLELGMGIWQIIEECDSFAFLNTEDYLESFWTSMEVIAWRFYRRNPIAYSMGGSPGRFAMSEVSFNPMGKAGREWWLHVYDNLMPYATLRRSRWASVDRGGRYFRKYYILPCTSCGEYSLLAKWVTP
jgi:hypothetical protein